MALLIRYREMGLCRTHFHEKSRSRTFLALILNYKILIQYVKSKGSILLGIFYSAFVPFEIHWRQHAVSDEVLDKVDVEKFLKIFALNKSFDMESEIIMRIILVFLTYVISLFI